MEVREMGKDERPRCAAEVWLSSVVQHRCTRLSTISVVVHGRPVFVCTQHQRTARRRGEWLFLGSNSYATWIDQPIIRIPEPISPPERTG